MATYTSYWDEDFSTLCGSFSDVSYKVELLDRHDMHVIPTDSVANRLNYLDADDNSYDFLCESATDADFTGAKWKCTYNMDMEYLQ